MKASSCIFFSLNFVTKSKIWDNFRQKNIAVKEINLPNFLFSGLINYILIIVSMSAYWERLRMYFLRLESHFLGRLISFTGPLTFFTRWHRKMNMNEKRCVIFYVNALGIWNLDFWHPRGTYIHINIHFMV